MTTVDYIAPDKHSTGFERLESGPEVIRETKPERQQSRGLIPVMSLTAHRGGTVPSDYESFVRVVLDTSSSAFDDPDPASFLEELGGQGFAEPGELILRYYSREPRVFALVESPTADQDPPTTLGELRRMALATSAADVPEPDQEVLGPNPLSNVRALFGLTNAQLADILGVTERQTYRLSQPDQPLPAIHRTVLEALAAVGAVLAGGLSPEGRLRWMESGDPSGLDLLHQNRLEELRARAEALRDSVAT